MNLVWKASQGTWKIPIFITYPLAYFCTCWEFFPPFWQYFCLEIRLWKFCSQNIPCFPTAFSRGYSWHERTKIKSLTISSRQGGLGKTIFMICWKTLFQLMTLVSVSSYYHVHLEVLKGKKVKGVGGG